MLGHQGVELFERITRTGCGLVGVAMDLFEKMCHLHLGVGFKVSEAQSRPSVTLSSCCLSIYIQNYHLLLQHHVCLLTTMLPAMTIMESYK